MEQKEIEEILNNDFLLIEDYDTEKMKEKLKEKFKKINESFTDYVKLYGKTKLDELVFNEMKYIVFDIDRIFHIEGKVLLKYQLDKEKNIYMTDLQIIDLSFKDPLNNNESSLELLLFTIKNYLKDNKINTKIYSDNKEIDFIDDFETFIKKELLSILNTYFIVNYNCIKIKKLGKMVEIEALFDKKYETTENYIYELNSNFDTTYINEAKYIYPAEILLRENLLNQKNTEELRRLMIEV